MPLQKILFKPGVNRENTRYTTEGGWFDSDKIRFAKEPLKKLAVGHNMRQAYLQVFVVRCGIG